MVYINKLRDKHGEEVVYNPIYRNSKTIELKIKKVEEVIISSQVQET